MDVNNGNIFKTIASSSTVTLNGESAKEWGSSKNSNEFPVIKPAVLEGLSKTLTRILLYKVSPEAVQRYSVRLHVIDTLRDWSRLKEHLEELSAFKDIEKSSKFLFHVLKKYLSQEVICGCENVDDLVQLAELFMNPVEKDDVACKRLFTKVVERILGLEQSGKSEKFLRCVLKKNAELNLDSSLVEKIYTIQKSTFIEKPLADCYNEFCLDETKDENFNKLDFLFEKVVDSPSLFHLISNYLKDLFVKDYFVQSVQNFIKKVLEKIQIHCDKYNKDTLDLYPTSLQFCVLLLRIDKCHHTEESKNQTVQSLKQIFLKDNNGALILVSHFPEWLSDYLKFFEILEEPSQNRLSQRSQTKQSIENVN